MAKKESVLEEKIESKSLEGYFLIEEGQIYFFESKGVLVDYLNKNHEDTFDWTSKDSFTGADRSVYLSDNYTIIKGSLIKTV